ncbi:Di-copper centre-containing protein [Acephala macrosclerotiorum]|nr:Di-copper centre-containing protein [Acephala macrosclerotiorum]
MPPKKAKAAAAPVLRLRRSLQVMWQEYLTDIPEKQKPINDLVRAWYGITQLPPNHENSFFTIGGYHGEPFRGAGYGSSAWWGGWCNHGNVLFPTWHRAYMMRIENALRSIKGCENVTMPYWDETSEETLKSGVPTIFLWEKFPHPDFPEPIDNPLFSYEFPVNITDNVDPNHLYTKAKTYKTVRYPLSGLVGTEKVMNASAAHNAQFTAAEASTALNSNVRNWLGQEIEVTVKGKKTNIKTGTFKKFDECLRAPNFTVFSNTTSAGAWNDIHEATDHAVPLESPHNDIHLAVGGFDVPNQGDFSHVSGANGDMGESDTAGLDPIFYFHHCNIDRYFWGWQCAHKSKAHLELTPEFAGTNTVDSQGPTPGMAGGTWLTLETPLRPFTNSDGSDVLSTDMVDIEHQLGYKYETIPKATPKIPGHAAVASVRVSGVNKNHISGSHQLAIWAKGPTGLQLVGMESVLSRWHTSGCKNCQANADTVRWIPLPGIDPEDVDHSREIAIV